MGVLTFREAIEIEGWSVQLEKALADKLGTTTRTIRTYKLEVVTRVAARAAELDELPPEIARSEFLDRLRVNQRAARKAGKWGAVASMLGLEARILGLGIEAKVKIEGGIAVGVEVRALRDVSALPEHVLELLARGVGDDVLGELVDSGGGVRELPAPSETA